MKKEYDFSKGKRNPLSTYEREMKNARFKKEFEKSYKQFLLSELGIAANDRKSRSK
jgi:hypothetical protein